MIRQLYPICMLCVVNVEFIEQSLVRMMCLRYRRLKLGVTMMSGRCPTNHTFLYLRSPKKLCHHLRWLQSPACPMYRLRNPRCHHWWWVFPGHLAVFPMQVTFRQIAASVEAPVSWSQITFLDWILTRFQLHQHPLIKTQQPCGLAALLRSRLLEETWPLHHIQQEVSPLHSAAWMMTLVLQFSSWRYARHPVARPTSRRLLQAPLEMSWNWLSLLPDWNSCLCSSIQMVEILRQTWATVSLPQTPESIQRRGNFQHPLLTAIWMNGHCTTSCRQKLQSRHRSREMIETRVWGPRTETVAMVWNRLLEINYHQSQVRDLLSRRVNWPRLICMKSSVLNRMMRLKQRVGCRQPWWVSYGQPLTQGRTGPNVGRHLTVAKWVGYHYL